MKNTLNKDFINILSVPFILWGLIKATIQEDDEEEVVHSVKITSHKSAQLKQNNPQKQSER